jgi:hypothetical protein
MLIVLIIIGVVFLCTIIGIGGILLVFQQEVASTQEAFGEDILQICDPIRGGTADEDHMPEDRSYPLKAVVIQEGMSYVGRLHDDLNSEWQATSRDDVDIVICVRKTTRVIEECAYSDSDDEEDDIAFIEREQRVQQISLFNPNTRDKIAEMTIEGALPEECPDVLQARDGSTRTQTGPEVEFGDFEDAIRPYITDES